MEVKIEDKKLIIVIDLQDPTPGASGKTLVVVTTHGNIPTECEIDIVFPATRILLTEN